MLTIVIPVHNQKNQMIRIVNKLSKLLNNKKIKYEIIIAEDGSTDGSYEIAKKLAKRKNIKLSHKKEKCGKGAAIKRGAQLASYTKLLFLDADTYNHLEELKYFIDLLKDYDIVIGSRYLKESKVKRSLIRKIPSHIYNLLVRVMFHTGIKDHQCGFKAFSRKGIELIKTVRSDGFFFDTELLVMAKNKNYKIKEIPIHWSEKKSSQVNILKDSFKMILDILKLKIRLMLDI